MLKRLAAVAALFVLPLLVPAKAHAQSLAPCTSFPAVNHQATETTYTLSPNDRCATLILNNTAADTITVPPGSQFFPQGWSVQILETGAGGATLSTSLGGNINGASSVTLTGGSNQAVLLYGDGSNWWAIGSSAQASAISGLGSACTAKTSGGATAASVASVGASCNLILGTPASGTVFAGGSTAANAGFQVPTIANSVNQWIATSAATGGTATLTVGGSSADANAPGALAANGTGALLLGGTTTTLAGLQVAQTASRVNDLVVTPGATGNAVTVLAGGAGADAAEAITFGTGGTGTISFDTAGTAVQLQILHTGAAVNNLTVTGSTGTAVLPISATGTGATLPIGIFPKGTSLVALGGTTVANASAQVNTVASSVDFAAISGSATGAPGDVVYGVGGTDAQVDVSLRSAGTTSKLRLGDSYTNYVTITGSAAGNPMIAPSGNNLLLGGGAQLLQNATTGFVAIPSNATGKPSGAPVGAGTGAVPMSVDPTPEVCFYIGGAWKCAALA